jgi:ComF family protein
MASTVRTLTTYVVNTFLDFVYPRVCLNCQRLLPDGYEYVCRDCWDSIPRIHTQHELYRETKAKLVADGNVTDLISCFMFQTEGTFQSLAHAMKYEGFERLGVWLGRELGKAVVEREIRADFLIPIPLHKRKFRERGYNQAEAIARGVSAVAGIPVRADIVRRTRFTETQTKLNVEARQKNMEDAFRVIPPKNELLRGKRCILVDDVITTGATLNACAEELRNAGASSVVAASLALAQ